MLTRIEEIILLTVHRLGDDAYGMQIKKEVEHLTHQNYSIGAIYVPLDRLAAGGYLATFEADPQPVRGGRRKKIYELTPEGLLALAEVRSMHERLWKGVPKIPGT